MTWIDREFGNPKLIKQAIITLNINSTSEIFKPKKWMSNRMTKNRGSILVTSTFQSMRLIMQAIKLNHFPLLQIIFQAR